MIMLKLFEGFMTVYYESHQSIIVKLILELCLDAHIFCEYVFKIEGLFKNMLISLELYPHENIT